ncbi:MAG: IS21 family transposase [Planctomycetes bacterium]|nr:IS21 family transposase [Planctomycetota bacterium]
MGKTQEFAVVKVGISERSGRRLEKGEVEHLNGPRTRAYRTRVDAFEEVWPAVIVPLLQANPGLQANTILGYLQGIEPGCYPDATLRTLQRRVHRWRRDKVASTQGRIFPQKHCPGQMGICDFTDMSGLGVTIAGRPFEHRIFHFRLSYSGWAWAEVILGGESYPALAEGLERSLSALGGVPQTLRTDSLSAAYRNLAKEERDDFTKSFEALVAHYGMQPTRNNRGVAHENGSIESPHGHLKRMVDQTLMLRNTRDFETEAAYRDWLRELIRRANRERQPRLDEDMRALRPLPPGRPKTWKEFNMRVNDSGLITVDKVVYALEEKWIDQRLQVHLFDDRLELFEGQDLVDTLKRKRRSKSDGGRHIYAIDYRVIIRQLVRKPGAFPGLRYRDDVHPCGIFRRCWEALSAALDPRRASKEYLGMLLIAHEQTCEDALRERIDGLLEKNELPRLAVIDEEFGPKRKSGSEPAAGPELPEPGLSSYDRLVEATLDS